MQDRHELLQLLLKKIQMIKRKTSYKSKWTRLGTLTTYIELLFHGNYTSYAHINLHTKIFKIQQVHFEIICQIYVLK